MAQKTTPVRVTLDKVLRTKIDEIKALNPAYRGMSPYQVATMELRYRVFGEVQRLKTGKKDKNPNDGWNGTLSRGPAGLFSGLPVLA